MPRKRYPFRVLLDKLLERGLGYDEIHALLEPQAVEIVQARIKARASRTAKQNADPRRQSAMGRRRAAKAKRNPANGRFLPNNPS